MTISDPNGFMKGKALTRLTDGQNDVALQYQHHSFRRESPRACLGLTESCYLQDRGHREPPQFSIE